MDISTTTLFAIFLVFVVIVIYISYKAGKSYKEAFKCGKKWTPEATTEAVALASASGLREANHGAETLLLNELIAGDFNPFNKLFGS